MLGKDFKEFVALFDANAVEYLIVGGYAMVLHGRPRQTGGLEVWEHRTMRRALLPHLGLWASPNSG